MTAQVPAERAHRRGVRPLAGVRAAGHGRHIAARQPVRRRHCRAMAHRCSVPSSVIDTSLSTTSILRLIVCIRHRLHVLNPGCSWCCWQTLPMPRSCTSARHSSSFSPSAVTVHRVSGSAAAALWRSGRASPRACGTSCLSTAWPSRCSRRRWCSTTSVRRPCVSVLRHTCTAEIEEGDPYSKYNKRFLVSRILRTIWVSHFHRQALLQLTCVDPSRA